MPNLIADSVGDVRLTSVNNMYLEEIERLVVVLHNENLTQETKEEINKTIQGHLKTIQKQMLQVAENEKQRK